jgi:anti-sigma regulatory factor (Ser/Thr protein kinase)
MNQTKIHISERFFTKAKRYFGSLDSALSEALQNAYRATLPRLRGGEVCNIDVHWNSTVRSLQIRDHGVGIDDIGAALSIGLSNWGKGVEEEQDPAGMGLCGVMAFCSILVFRSQFGRLEVDTKKFFESKEYRDALLDTIDTGDFLNGEGTEITMVGVAAEDEFAVHGALTKAAQYHTAIRIKFANNDKEPEIVRNFLETSNWKLRETPYRGYKVYDYQHVSGYGCNYNRDQLLVIWHGQCIKVSLEYVKIKIRLPEVENLIETTLKLPDFESMAIVIDYGCAPVTPKLPDRNALIMDDKTVEFISGLFLPEFESRIEEVRAGMIEQAAILKDGKPEERRDAVYQLVHNFCGRRQHWQADNKDRLCTKLTDPLFTALYNHYVGLARVRTMAPRDLSDGKDDHYEIDLMPFDALPAVLANRVVLWSDTSSVGRVIDTDNDNTNRFIIKEYGIYDAEKVDWSKKDTVCENGFEVIPGVCTEIDAAVGNWHDRYDDVKLKKATVVVHTKKTEKELGWVKGESIHQAIVEITEGPVQLSLIITEDEDESEVDLDAYNKRDIATGDDLIAGVRFEDLIANAPKLEVPCLMVRLDDDMEPSGSIFAGPEAEVLKLTHVAAGYEQGGSDSHDDMSSEEWAEYVTETWDDFRSKISGVPELNDVVTELVNKIRSRVQVEGSRASIVSLSINVDKKVLTFRTAKGKPVKTKYR